MLVLRLTGWRSQEGNASIISSGLQVTLFYVNMSTLFVLSERIAGVCPVKVGDDCGNVHYTHNLAQ